jgi:cell division transport system permease protein
MMAPKNTKERTIGRAEKRRYDLPLNKGAGTLFLITLIALMTFLAMMAVASSFALGEMTHRWSSGLENRITVEIPAQSADSKLMTREEVFTLTRSVANALYKQPGITNIHVLGNDEIAKLVEPWLGEDFLGSDFPIPGMIALEVTNTDTRTLQTIHSRIKAITENARLDTHEEWLNDLLRFTGALQLAAILLVAVIGMTTITAVAGAVRSRMDINRAEVELLHLMGASDRYITRQFQRHSLILALKGGAVGTALGVASLLLIGWVAGEMGVAILPDFKLTPIQMVILGLTPFLAALISSTTARWTVTRVLTTFP